MPREYSNKLAIYLIKKGITNSSQIFKNLADQQFIDLNLGTLYYSNSFVYEPNWVEKFFGASFSNTNSDGSRKIFNASAKAVLLIRAKGRIFAVTFGHGRSLLAPGTCEERFGLKVLLNIVDSEIIRSIDKKSMSSVPKLSREQMSKSSTISDFGFDIEQDLIQGMTAQSKLADFGKTVTGKDALTVSAKVDLRKIKPFLELCYEKYLSKDYEKDFKWIDHVAEISDPKKTDDLNQLLIDKIRARDFDKTWMAVPVIVPWEDVKHFEIAETGHVLGDDLRLGDFIDSLPVAEKGNIKMETFSHRTINCIAASSDQQIDTWRASDCLCSEITVENQTFVLSNGKWYEIEKSFAEQVNKDYVAMRDSMAPLALPTCQNNEHEDKYNLRAGASLAGACCMDRQVIVHGDLKSKIEFCDLMTSDKQIIHVKHYGNSSVLSHLFAQGLVSAELFLGDQQFREKVNGKLPASHRGFVTATKPIAAEFSIVFAIISKRTVPLDIPFFSKVSLKHSKRRLEAFGYKVIFQKIDMETT